MHSYSHLGTGDRFRIQIHCQLLRTIFARIVTLLICSSKCIVLLCIILLCYTFVNRKPIKILDKSNLTFVEWSNSTDTTSRRCWQLKSLIHPSDRSQAIDTIRVKKCEAMINNQTVHYKDFSVLYSSELMVNVDTIVTSYFEFDLDENQRHSVVEYRKWIQNWISYTITPIVIYTNKGNNFIQDVLQQRISLNHSTIVIEIDLRTYEFYKKYHPIYEKNYQLLKPVNRKRGNPDIFVVWALKHVFLSEISQINPFDSQYFFWFDIGTWRYNPSSFVVHNLRNYQYLKRSKVRATIIQQGVSNMKSQFKLSDTAEFEIDTMSMQWPDPQRVINVFEKCQHCIMVTFVKPTRITKKCIEYTKPSIAGGMFGGTKTAINWYKNEFFRVHAMFIENDIFSGNDQHIMNVIFYNQSKSETNHMIVFNSSVTSFPTNAYRCSHWFEWSYYQLYFTDQQYLAKEQQQNCSFDDGKRILLRSEMNICNYHPEKPFCSIMQQNQRMVQFT